MSFLKRKVSKRSLEELNKYREEPNSASEKSTKSLEYSVQDITSEMEPPLRQVISMPPDERT